MLYQLSYTPRPMLPVRQGKPEIKPIVRARGWFRRRTRRKRGA